MFWVLILKIHQAPRHLAGCKVQVYVGYDIENVDQKGLMFRIFVVLYGQVLFGRQPEKCGATIALQNHCGELAVDTWSSLAWLPGYRGLPFGFDGDRGLRGP